MNPYQWSLAKQGSLKVENDSPKVQKQAEAKFVGVINQQIYNFNQFQYGTFWCSERHESTVSTVDVGYMCPRGLICPPALTLAKQMTTVH